MCILNIIFKLSLLSWITTIFLITIGVFPQLGLFLATYNLATQNNQITYKVFAYSSLVFFDKTVRKTFYGPFFYNIQEI